MSDPSIYRQLSDLEERLRRLETVERAPINYGAAFPASWPTNLPYYRTDLGLWAYYDGVRWLSEQEYEAPFNGPATAFSAAPATIGFYALPDASILVTLVTLSAFVLTTNNGSNYWTIRFGDESGTIQDLTTQAHGPGAWSRTQAEPDSVRTVTHLEAIVQAKTGTPGNIFLGATIRYRRVLT